MMKQLNNLSLRWKFMVAPILGIIMTSLLYATYLYISQKQEQELSQIQQEILTKNKLLMKSATDLATNHTRVYELLIYAEKNEDESKIYDMGKPLLNEIHRIEANAKKILSDKQFTRLLLSLLVEYKKAVITAIEMATVDLSLAHRYMTYAIGQFNVANSQYLALGEAMQNEVEKQLISHHESGQAVQQKFGLLLFIVVILVLVISQTLSKLLTRSFQQAIRFLNELSSTKETIKSKSELIQLLSVIDHVK